MTLAALIRKSETARLATATPATVATLEGDKGRIVATVATVSVATPTEAITATAFRWWLIHYPDRELVEVACFPPATHAEILERHPEAIAAEPITQAAPELARKSCSTCTHETGRKGCGEPVGAGLSDVVGVIRYNPDQVVDCPAWLAVLDADAKGRILAMAERWRCSGDDLALALAGARSDPEGWGRVVEADEQKWGE